jgi:hypothetical protein
MAERVIAAGRALEDSQGFARKFETYVQQLQLINGKKTLERMHEERLTIVQAFAASHASPT